jgi:adenylate cyclase
MQLIVMLWILREGDALPDDEAGAATAGGRAIDPRPVTIKHYVSDDSIFFGADYLIKGVAGRILWRLLDRYVRAGSTEFSNRELRLDPELKLPAPRDNLEARLSLLRKRLYQQCDFLAVVPTARGRFRLEVERALALEEIAER